MTQSINQSARRLGSLARRIHHRRRYYAVIIIITRTAARPARKQALAAAGSAVGPSLLLRCRRHNRRAAVIARGPTDEGSSSSGRRRRRGHRGVDPAPSSSPQKKVPAHRSRTGSGGFSLALLHGKEKNQNSEEWNRPHITLLCTTRPRTPAPRRCPSSARQRHAPRRESRRTRVQSNRALVMGRERGGSRGRARSTELMRRSRRCFLFCSSMNSFICAVRGGAVSHGGTGRWSVAEDSTSHLAWSTRLRRTKVLHPPLEEHQALGHDALAQVLAVLQEESDESLAAGRGGAVQERAVYCARRLRVEVAQEQSWRSKPRRRGGLGVVAAARRTCQTG